MFSLCNFSHQYAGLNRSGTFRKPSRYKGSRTDGRGDAANRERGEFCNVKWRRITGIFPHVEMSMKERRAGLARLAAWIDAKIQNSKRKIGAFAESPEIANDSHEPLSHEDTKTRSFSGQEASSCLRDFVVEVEEQGEFARAAKGNQRLPVAHKPNTGGQATSGTREISLVEEWDFSAESWARTRYRGVCVEEVCVELEISAAKLSALLREYCGMSASEFVDGLMIRGLKPLLFEKIRAAAFELWGAPGSYVWEKLGTDGRGDSETRRRGDTARTGEGVKGRRGETDGPGDTETGRWGETDRKGEGEKGGRGDGGELVGGTPSSRGGELGSHVEFVAPDSRGHAERAGAQALSKVAGRGRPAHQFVRRSNSSNYFRMQSRDLFEESRAEERERRLKELCEILRARQGRTGGQATSGTPWHGRPAREFELADIFGSGLEIFDAEAFALHAGFGSSATLKRACLNVFGKTLRRLEEVLAEEVLQFFLCAEDKELREIASRENEIAIVFRARELYHRSEDPPKEPFLGEWSKFEELRPHWLSRMKDMMRHK